MKPQSEPDRKQPESTVIKLLAKLGYHGPLPDRTSRATTRRKHKPRCNYAVKTRLEDYYAAGSDRIFRECECLKDELEQRLKRSIKDKAALQAEIDRQVEEFKETEEAKLREDLREFKVFLLAQKGGLTGAPEPSTRPAVKQLVRTAVCDALDPYLRELVAALSTQLGQEQRMLADYLAAEFTGLAERLVRHEAALTRILKLHDKKPGAPFQSEN